MMLRSGAYKSRPVLSENQSLRRAEVVDDGHATVLAVERGHRFGDGELRLRGGFQLLGHGCDIAERRLNQPHQLVETTLDLFKLRITRLPIKISHHFSYVILFYVKLWLCCQVQAAQGPKFKKISSSK